MSTQTQQAQPATLPADYAERVYAGALGKVLGVYLGRPFEGWSHERIAEQLGDIDYYVHDKVGVPLIVADDDISGTFTFLRALPDHGNDPDLTPAQIGDTWLNYIVEERAILWWGGLGTSTEHTAFLRLTNGIPAPDSGSMRRNGQVVAEQIGAQIFIDGWAMVAPGQPVVAADLARRAGSVSHDGESVYAAQLLAAMEAQAFVESDIDALLDTGLSVVPPNCLIARMIADIRGWHRTEPDWRAARDLLDRDYGYHAYGGGCHVIPNHGLIVLALLYGGGDWDRSMMIVNTCGWDTDCNSGNLGCLLGIRNGLAAFDGARDWRGPVADRLYLPTADGGRAVSDVAGEAVRIANIGRALAGEPPVEPKGGARFHFEFPGSVQGFTLDTPEAAGGRATLVNVAGNSRTGQRSLAIRCADLSAPTTVSTPTFLPAEAFGTGGYHLLASPTLYPGQSVTATLVGDAGNLGAVRARLVARYHAADDVVEQVAGTPVDVAPGEPAELALVVPDLAGAPVCSVGVSLEPGDTSDPGAVTVYLDRLTWAGAPDAVLGRPDGDGSMWWRAWVDATDTFRHDRADQPFDVVQNRGRGLLLHGTREWRDYEVSVDVTPHLAEAAGVAVRAQGLRRYYALLLDRAGQARLVRMLDGEQVLAKADMAWQLDRSYRLALRVLGDELVGSVDGAELFRVRDDAASPTAGPAGLDGGGVGLVVDEGHVLFGPVQVRPAGGGSAND